MTTIFWDLRYGARMLLKTPAITFIVILALALGIGNSNGSKRPAR